MLSDHSELLGIFKKWYLSILPNWRSARFAPRPLLPEIPCIPIHHFSERSRDVPITFVSLHDHTLPAIDRVAVITLTDRRIYPMTEDMHNDLDRMMEAQRVDEEIHKLWVALEPTTEGEKIVIAIHAMNRSIGG
jgi:hypothetical protein